MRKKYYNLWHERDQRWTLAKRVVNDVVMRQGQFTPWLLSLEEIVAWLPDILGLESYHFSMTMSIEIMNQRIIRTGSHLRIVELTLAKRKEIARFKHALKYL